MSLGTNDPVTKYRIEHSTDESFEIFSVRGYSLCVDETKRRTDNSIINSGDNIYFIISPEQRTRRNGVVNSEVSRLFAKQRGVRTVVCYSSLSSENSIESV